MLDDRERAIALLEATHTFPVDYHLSVITISQPGVTVALRDAVELGLHNALADEAHVTLASSGGKYTSHRFTVPCSNAEEVLALYERVRLVDGVITIL